ncbi:MAG: hypothetical protein LUE17_00735 [Planctomycetaceae bacterium]|nr:hypothetical protein [Planctomycetaceae bacterium]
MKTTAKAIGVDVKIAFAAVFLASRFFPSAFLADALVCLTLLMAALCLRRVTAVNLFVSGALVAIGMAMLARSGAGLERWREGVLENAGIVALVMSTPLLAVCLRFYDFEADIRAFAARHVRNGIGFYVLLLVVSFVVAMLLNMSAVPPALLRFREPSQKLPRAHPLQRADARLLHQYHVVAEFRLHGGGY